MSAIKFPTVNDTKGGGEAHVVQGNKRFIQRIFATQFVCMANLGLTASCCRIVTRSRVMDTNRKYGSEKYLV